MDGDVVGPHCWKPTILQDVVTIECILNKPNACSPALEAIRHEDRVDKGKGSGLNRFDVTIAGMLHSSAKELHLLALDIPNLHLGYPRIVA